MNRQWFLNWLIALALFLSPLSSALEIAISHGDNRPSPSLAASQGEGQGELLVASPPFTPSLSPASLLASTEAVTSTVWLPLVLRDYQAPPDADGDGLPDRFEDANGNGIVEAELGETDPYDPDCDDDGLTDGQEVRVYGSNPWSVDGDGDGLGDYLEAYTTHTSPALADTDADGLTDGEEDTDHDGVLDPGETDPNNLDTDGDGLTDGEERTLGTDGYITDPRNPDTDADGLTDGQEAAAGTNPTLVDPDGDGLGDPEEITTGADGYVTDPLNADTDGDGLDDGQEAAAGSDPLNVDTDTDDLPDAAEVITYNTDPTLADTDADTLGDYAEVITYTTNPANPDTDADGLPDPWEVHYGLDPLSNDAGADPDSDGLTNLQEYGLGTDPARPDSDEDGLPDGAEISSSTDPLDFDSDDDQLADGVELTAGTDPLNADSDGDGLLDGLEPGWNADLDGDGTISALDTDADGDGLPDATEDTDLDGQLDPGETSPGKADTDADGMTDPWELLYGFDPQNPADRDGDPDLDGLANRLEFTAGTDPHNPDSDSDQLPDGLEVGLGLDPTDPSDAAADLDADQVTNLAEYLAGTGIDDPDSDGDGIIDGQEGDWNQDTDGDGLINALDADADGDSLADGDEVFVYFTDPLDTDTDDDGLTDGDEVLVYHTDPLSTDSDHDQVPDGIEVAAGTGPLDADSDDDTLPDGQELVAGWNGDLVEAESLGAPYTDPVYGNQGAVHGGTSHILTWTVPDLPPGQYRVYFRARSLGSAADLAGLTVKAGGGAPFSHSFQMLDKIYRWHSSDAFSLAITATVVVTLTDPQAPSTSALVDRLMVVAREADPVFRTTWATDADSDEDSLKDGLETARDSTWIEAEHYPTGGVSLIDDLEASNSRLVRNTLANQVLVTVPPDHHFGPLSYAPPWRYQLFIRARRIPAVDPNANLTLAVKVSGQNAIGPVALQRLTDRFEWQTANIVVQLSPADTLQITVTAQTAAAQAVDVDKLLVTPLWFEAVPQNAPCCDPPAGGNGELIHPHPLAGVVRLVDDDGNLPNVRALYTGALDALGVEYDIWDVATQGDPAPSDLLNYGAVVWFTGQPASNTFNSSNEAAVTAYLNAGGRFFLSSTDYLTERGLTPFGLNYLRVASYVDNQYKVNLVGNAGDPIGSGLGPYVLTQPTGWTPWPPRTDYAEPGAGASAPFGWLPAPGQAGADYDSGSFRTVFFPWPFEGLADLNARTTLMGRILDWMDLGTQQAGINAAVVILKDQPYGLTDPLDMDTDGDGDRLFSAHLPNSAGYLTDAWEMQIGTNPFDIDTDGDADLYPADQVLDDYGGPDWTDCKPNRPPDSRPDWTDDTDCNPLSVDIDNDEILDPIDPLPLDDDIDNDALKDGSEDLDLQGSYTPPEETDLGTPPITATLCPTASHPGFDTDGDGLGDGLERGLTAPQGISTTLSCFTPDADSHTTTDPRAADTDGDGLWDGPNDPNGHGEDTSNFGARDPGETDPRVADSDHDRLNDGPEVLTYATDPLVPDSDGDGLTDGEEVFDITSSPVMTDTDGDGFSDGVEADYDPAYAISDTLHPPIVSPGILYLLDGDPDAQGWVKVGNTLVSTGTVLIGGQQSGSGRRIQAAGWRRASRYLAGDRPYRIRINGRTVVDQTTGTVTGVGSVDVIIDDDHYIRIIDAGGSFSLDPTTGALTGSLNASVGVGDYQWVTLEMDDTSWVDATTGEIHGDGRVILSLGGGLSTILEGAFVVQPAALKVAYSGDISLVIGSLSIPLRSAEAEIDFTNGYFHGNSYVEIPNIGPIVNSGPKAEFTLDLPSRRLHFCMSSSATASLDVGPISLELGKPGLGFYFELDLITGYFHLQVENIDLGAATINNVEIEIDPSGDIPFDPEYTVPGYLDGSFSGHLRFAGDVSIVIPVRHEAKHDHQSPHERRPEKVGLMLNIQGEEVIRIPNPDGSGFLWATNSTLGIELSADYVTLGVEIGGATAVFSDLLGTDPLLAIGVGQKGLALKDLGLGLPDALGNIYPLPGTTVVFLYHIAEQRLEGAGRYNYLGLEAGIDFSLGIDDGLAITGTLDVPLGGLEVDVTGSLDWQGNLLLTGTSDLTWFGMTMASGTFTLDNGGLQVTGTVTIPNVGSAWVGGAIYNDGTFSFTGHAQALSPGGWRAMSADVTWTNTQLTLSGSVQTPVGSVSVSGQVTASSFRLTGSGNLGFAGFSMLSASVTIDSATGLYAQGSLSVPGAGSVSLAGYIQTNGYFALSGSGVLAPAGYQLLDASFTLSKDASGGRFAASGSLHLANATISAGVTIESDGDLWGSGSLDWGGLHASVSLSIVGGVVSVSGSVEIDATYNGYGIIGTLAFSASGSSIYAELSFEAELAGYTVFSGEADVSSSGRLHFRACTCGYSYCCVEVTIYLW